MVKLHGLPGRYGPELDRSIAELKRQFGEAVAK